MTQTRVELAGAPAVSRLTFVPGESPGHDVHFWDPVVDGRALRELVSGPGADLADWCDGYVPVLVHDWPRGSLEGALVLLGERPSPLANGRVPVFVCGACGDLGCGAITAAVARTADTVVWRDFGWDVDHETEEDEDDDAVLFAGPLVFARSQYEDELRHFVDTFREVRASLPVRRPAAPPEAPPRRRLRDRWRSR